jgi:hypothetical protein
MLGRARDDAHAVRRCVVAGDDDGDLRRRHWDRGVLTWYRA